MVEQRFLGVFFRMATGSSLRPNCGTSWPTWARSWQTKRWTRWSGRPTSMETDRSTTKVSDHTTGDERTRRLDVIFCPFVFRVCDDDDQQVGCPRRRPRWWRWLRRRRRRRWRCFSLVLSLACLPLSLPPSSLPHPIFPSYQKPPFCSIYCLHFPHDVDVMKLWGGKNETGVSQKVKKKKNEFRKYRSVCAETFLKWQFFIDVLSFFVMLFRA